MARSRNPSERPGSGAASSASTCASESDLGKRAGWRAERSCDVGSSARSFWRTSQR